MTSRALRELLGPDRPVADITRQDCRRVQDILTALPPNASKRFRILTLEEAAARAKAEGLPTLHPASVNCYPQNLSALFRWAVQERHIEHNPAAGLSVPVTKGHKKTRKEPFDTEQLRAIFAAPLYAGCQNDGEGYAQPGPDRPRRGRFRVPLLSLWSGTRLNECCQLLVSDVRLIDGVDCIPVEEDEWSGGDKRLKIEAGERLVPTHPELKRIGFLQHVSAMREAGEVRLLPELSKGRNGYYPDSFQKWFG